MYKCKGVCDHCMNERMIEYDKKCTELFPEYFRQDNPKLDLHLNKEFIALQERYTVDVISIEIDNSSIELCFKCITKLYELI